MNAIYIYIDANRVLETIQRTGIANDGSDIRELITAVVSEIGSVLEPVLYDGFSLDANEVLVLTLPGPTIAIHDPSNVLLGKLNEHDMQRVSIEIAQIIDDCMDEISETTVDNNGGEVFFSDQERGWLEFQQYLYANGIFNCDVETPEAIDAIIDGVFADIAQEQESEV